MCQMCLMNCVNWNEKKSCNITWKPSDLSWRIFDLSLAGVCPDPLWTKRWPVLHLGLSGTKKSFSQPWPTRCGIGQRSFSETKVVTAMYCTKLTSDVAMGRRRLGPNLLRKTSICHYQPSSFKRTLATANLHMKMNRRLVLAVDILFLAAT